MPGIAAKHETTVARAVGRLIARASDARGLDEAELRPRVESAIEKYVLRHDPDAGDRQLAAFVDEIHADDLCLVIACERGDEKAWEELVAKYDATVKAAARKIAPNSEDAEELAGSIWADLYGLRQDAAGNRKSKLGYYSGRGSLGGWLRAIVSQSAIDEFRKQSKLVQIEEDREFENIASGVSSNDHHAAHGNDPELILTEKRTAADVTAALKNAIERLEDEDRLVLKLYYFDDLKLKEIGQMFGYHEATASRRLVRIQADIRKAVERELKKTHGWTDTEVKKYLSETAEALGLSLEKLLTVLMIAAVVQDAIMSGVL